MDLLKLLINSSKDSSLDTCFLCFKCINKNINIYTVFEIHFEYFDISLSLEDMMKSLFPYDDFLFQGVCDECSDLVIKLYILIHKRKIKSKLLNCIIKQLGKQTEEIIEQSGNNHKITLKVQVPTFNDLDVKRSVVNFTEHDYLDNTILPCETYSKSYDTEKIDEHKEVKFQFKTQKKKRQRKRTYYYCKDCTYKTLCKTTLQAHVNKKHLHTRPHTCQVCFKGFYNKSNLTEHVKTHNNQRNEVCEICGCRFIHKKNLLEHLRLHSDTRPFECDVCGKKFITSGRRSDHIKRSHMERSECCLICNKKYSLKKELTRHMNSVHLSI